MRKKTKKGFVTRVPLRLKQPNKMLLQARVNQQLLEAVRPVAKAHGMSMCSILEWGMKEFLAHVDPATAKQLKIEMNAVP